jgi:hypothetical protein
MTNSSIGYDETVGNDSDATLDNSTVGHDVKVGFSGFFGAGLATIGHDLIALHPGSIQISSTGPPPDGISVRVTVGHDFVVNGSPGPPGSGAFVLDSLCNLGVGNDLRMTNRWVTLGFSIGDSTLPFSACSGSQPDTVGAQGTGRVLRAFATRSRRHPGGQRRHVLGQQRCPRWLPGVQRRSPTTPRARGTRRRSRADSPMTDQTRSAARATAVPNTRHC